MAAIIDGEPERRDGALADTDFVRRFLAVQFEMGDPRMAAFVLDVVFQAHQSPGNSHQEKAMLAGTTDSNFSKLVNYYYDLFKPMGVRRPPACKSDAARAAYSRVQRKHHWRELTGMDMAMRSLRRK
jgi:hypothetical protein